MRFFSGAQALEINRVDEKDTIEKTYKSWQWTDFQSERERGVKDNNKVSREIIMGRWKRHLSRRCYLQARSTGAVLIRA